MGLMGYLFEQRDLSGTNTERRIDEVIAKGSSASTLYRLKTTTGQFNAHASKYSPELKKFVQDTLKDHIYYFGYANVEENPTGFFEFEQHAPEDLAKFNQYLTDREAAFDHVMTPGHEVKNYTHNREEVFDIFTEEDLSRLLDPGFDHARKTLQAAKESTQNAKDE